ncbi:hypothetical protein [Clostridium sp. BJN0013]|uniref:hypothetical protein n=1 Tax=Clostridium sp. BJN0013 TaxID=3236840 RepID=UPI0034C5E2D5
MNLESIPTKKLIKELKRRKEANIYEVSDNSPYYILIPNLIDVINNGSATIIEIHK